MNTIVAIDRGGIRSLEIMTDELHHRSMTVTEAASAAEVLNLISAKVPAHMTLEDAMDAMTRVDEYKALNAALRSRNEVQAKAMLQLAEKMVNPPVVMDKAGNICSIPSVDAMQRAEAAAREANARADALEKTLEEKELKIAALRSEIDAMRAGAESYKRRIRELEASLTELQNFTGYRKKADGTWDAFDSGGQMQYSLAKERIRVKELEAEKAAAGWDPSRPRFVTAGVGGVDTRPTMQELRGIIQDYAPKDYVYCVLKMLSRCGLVKP